MIGQDSYSPGYGGADEINPERPFTGYSISSSYSPFRSSVTVQDIASANPPKPRVSKFVSDATCNDGIIISTTLE